MSDIPPIQSTGQMAGLVPQRVASTKPPLADEFEDDQLEISETGQLLSDLGRDSGIRADKVAEIRQAIANGTYETEDKLNVTVDRLLEALQSMSVTA